MNANNIRRPGHIYARHVYTRHLDMWHCSRNDLYCVGRDVKSYSLTH